MAIPFIRHGLARGEKCIYVAVVISIADTGTGTSEALHQGTLTFDTKLDQGTTFHIKLPIGALAA